VVDLNTTKATKVAKKNQFLTFPILFERILINPTFWSSISYVALRMMLQPIQAILYVRGKPSCVAIKISQTINVEEIMEVIYAGFYTLVEYLKRARVIKPLSKHLTTN
jgi:hypothetical protein